MSLSLTGKDSGAELEDSMFTPRREKPVDRLQYDDLMAEYLKLAEAMKVIKKELATLQDLVSTNIAFCFDGKLSCYDVPGTDFPCHAR